MTATMSEIVVPVLPSIVATFLSIVPIGAGSTRAGALPCRWRSWPADREVRGEVLEQVADAALDDQRQQDAALDVLVGTDRLRTQGRDRLEADEQEDGDRRLVEHVDEAVRDDHRARRSTIS